MTVNQQVVGYVDRYQIKEINERQNCKVDVNKEAMYLKMLLNPLAVNQRCVAIINQDDKEGIEAYSDHGYRIQTMNGDRPEAMPHFINSELDQQWPGHIVVVSSHEAFVPLCKVASKADSKISVWSPDASIPKQLSIGKYDSRPLADLLPDTFIKLGSAGIWLDIENLFISLKEKGVRPNAKAFVKSINAAALDLIEAWPSIGNITSIIAFGDFEMLGQDFGRNLQRELETLGIRTRYQVNIRGKNSADMEIANDIHLALEREPNLQAVIIGTGDGDFRPTVDTAQKYGKKVGVMALKDNLSSKLKKAANEIILLDSYYQVPKPMPTTKSKTLQPDHPQMTLILNLCVTLQKHRWQWAFLEKLTHIAPKENWDKAAKEGALQSGMTSGKCTFSLHPKSPLAKAAKYFVSWSIDRIAYLMKDKVEPGRMAYIDTAYLARGVEMDSKCKQLGITRANAGAWLDAVAEAGYLLKQPRPHFKGGNGTVDTWWPAGYHDPTISEDKEGDPTPSGSRSSDNIESTSKSPDEQTGVEPESGHDGQEIPPYV